MLRLLITGAGPLAVVCGCFMTLALLAAGCGGGEADPDAGLAPQPAPLPATEAALEPDTVNIEVNPNYEEEPELAGWISATTLNVREAPSTGAGIVNYLFKGDRVQIFEEREADGTWYRVNDTAGYVDGWVFGRYVSGEPVASNFVIPDDYRAQRTPTADTEAEASYVGAGACQSCHSRPHGPFEAGAYGVWRDHFHADAYKTLSRPYTRAVARRRGITDPTTDWRCVKCHVTAYGIPASRKAPTYQDAEGVTCEACHGPGGDYLNSHWEGTPGYAEREARGFRIFRDIEERDVMCRACHNELSPTYKPFNVAAFSQAIRHWTDEHVFQEVARAEEAATVAPKPVAEVPPEPAPEPIPMPADEPVYVPPPVAVHDTPAAPPPTPQQPEEAQEEPAEQPAQPPPPTPAPQPAEQPAPQTQPSAPVATASSPRGPEDMMLDTHGSRGKVYFPHRAHFQYVNVEQEAGMCQVCHHTTPPSQTPTACGSCHQVQPTATPSREKAFHGTCRTCHREEQAGPTRCSDCHAN